MMQRLACALTVAGCAGNSNGVTASPSDAGPPLHADGDAGSAPTHQYVAMGSSAAAGPGIPDPVPGQTCGRSTNNYAHLVAADLGLDLTDVSCSGATTDNIAIAPQDSHPLQIAALTRDTQVVTVTVGGNDVNYWASLVTCGRDGANGTSCLAGDVDATAVDQLIGAEEQKLVAMIKAIQQAAPDARILLVAYPTFLPDPPVPCPPRAPFVATDATFLGAIGKNLQEAFRLAAQETGVRFIDVYLVSQGHDVCAPDGQRWVEGQTPPAVVPYHPNAAGMRAVADLIEVEIRRRF